MSPAGFELTVPTSEQSQTHALDRAANAIGRQHCASVRSEGGKADLDRITCATVCQRAYCARG